MRSVSEEMDIDDYQSQESDNEELINYISHRILSLEETFLNLCRNKTIVSQSGEGNEIELDKTHNYTDLIEELFREINIINETLMKVVKSNYTKNEKLTSVIAKFKKLFSKYSSLKVDMEVLKNDLKSNEERADEFEGILRNYEDDISKLQEKNRQLNEEIMRRQETDRNLHNMTLGPNFTSANINNPSLYMNILNDTFRNDETFNEQISFYEDVNKQMTKEKEEMKLQIHNLRSAIQKKEELISDLYSEIDFQTSKVKDLTEEVEKNKHEKNFIKNENETLHKEQMSNLKLIEELKMKLANLDRRSGRVQFRNSKKGHALSEDRNSLLDNVDFGEGRESIQSKQDNTPLNDKDSDDGLKTSKYSLRKQMSVRNKPSRYNMSSSLVKKSLGDDYGSNISLRNTIHENVNEAESANEGETTLANVLAGRSRSNSDNSDNNVYLSANNANNFHQKDIYTQGTSRISLTTSLDNIESGLRLTRSRLQTRAFFENSVDSSDGDGEDFIRVKKADSNMITNSKFSTEPNQFQNETLEENIKQTKIYSKFDIGNLYHDNVESFTIVESQFNSENQKNVNNIININFNNYDEKERGEANFINNNNLFQKPENKKLFFEFIYESLKMTKNFGKIANVVKKEDVLNNLNSKNIPFYKYYRSITNYLRKSEPNLINKFVPENTPQERIDKYIKNYNQETEYLKKKNKLQKKKINRMKIEINDLKRNENIEKRKNTSSLKNKTFNILPFIPSINISILESPEKKERKGSDEASIKGSKGEKPSSSGNTPNQKLMDFQNIFSKISNKWQEVEKIITKFTPSNNSNSPRKSLTPSNSKLNSRTNSLILNNHEQFKSNISSITLARASLRPVKEICFKIQKVANTYQNNNNTNWTPPNYTLSRQESLMIFPKWGRIPKPNAKINSKNNNASMMLAKHFPEGIRQLYEKYFKYRDTLMMDMLNKRKQNLTLSAREIRSGINKKLGLKGVVKFYPEKEMNNNLTNNLKLLNHMNDMNILNNLNNSLYFKSIVNKSNWMQGKD